MLDCVAYGAPLKPPDYQATSLDVTFLSLLQTWSQDDELHYSEGVIPVPLLGLCELQADGSEEDGDMQYNLWNL